MRIGMIGYGGVGRAFVRLLAEKKKILEDQGIGIQVNYILNSSGGIYNPDGIDCGDVAGFSDRNGRLCDYENGGQSGIGFKDIIRNRDIDVLVEMTSTNKETGEPGMTHIREALENGISVVTANKGPILIAYRELKAIAKVNNVQLAVGCTAGGALPSVNGGIIDMAGAEISSIEGILNGTTNFILKEMEEKGVDYCEALKKAQDLKIAEADPTLDVEGWDTATKILILSNILMDGDKTIKDVAVQGISGLTLEEVDYARKEGKRYKLIGRAERGISGTRIEVKLEKVSSDDLFFNVDGKNKAVRYKSDTLGELVMFGGASGVTPAAASVLRDLINISKGYRFV